MSTSVLAPPEPTARDEFFDLEAIDVTETTRVEARDVQWSLPASAVAKALAARMSLPGNVPWALRNNATSEFLVDDDPIGEQIDPTRKVSLTVTPKTHLG